MRLTVLVMTMALAAFSAKADWIMFTNLNLTIPDNNPMGLQNTQTLSGYANLIESIQVRLRISAAPADFAFNGDYYLSLQHNSGLAILLNRTGRTASDEWGYANNGFDITFSLSDPDIHLYQTFTPSYDVDGRLIGEWGGDGRNVNPATVVDTDARTAGLSTFNGLDPNGNWTLFVADMNLNAVGTLDQWGLNVTTIPEPLTGLLLLGAAGLGLLRRRIHRLRP